MRFSETNYRHPGQLDFIPRTRDTGIWKLIPAFSIVTTLLLMLLLAPETLGSKGFSAILTICVVAFLCFHIIYRKQQNTDLVMATEYQNMLFAQAAALGFNFCMFVRRDGTIVYANDGLRSLFTNFHHGEASALEGLFAEGNVAKIDRDRVMMAVHSSASERLIFPIQPTGRPAQDYVVTIDPLKRPGGFSVIRGREYLDARAGTQRLPDTLRSTSADKIDQLLSHSPIAQYVTDAFGRIEYATPAMNKLLGYTAEEMVDSPPTIQMLLHQINGADVPDDYTLSDHRCNVLLNKKHGQLAKAVLEQHVIRNAEGKIIGAAGSILSASTISE